MSANLFQGKLVKLVSLNPEEMAKNFNHWDSNSFYTRQLDDQPRVLYSEKKFKEWFEKDLENLIPEEYFFSIQTLDSQKVIGFVHLGPLEWNHGNTWVGIGIGEQDYWGKGYGTEAMQLILRYAFTELNLHRVSLDVFGFNQRAIRSYEKAGFVLEGVQRKIVQREGSFWDIHFMGVLREDWLKQGRLL